MGKCCDAFLSGTCYLIEHELFKFIHLPANLIIFLFYAQIISIVYVHHIFLINSSIEVV